VIDKVMSSILVGMLAGLILAVISVAVAVPIWVFWDWVCPDVFGLPQLTFVQAYILCLLVKVFLLRINVSAVAR